ncbi:MAG: redoxin, partial [Planctomycetota bacterium]
RRESRASKVFLALLLLAFVVAFIPWSMKSKLELRSKGRAPEIKAAGWINGEAPTTESLAGKVVVVCCWATWCGPCREEAPHLVTVHKKFAKQSVTFIGLTTDGEEELDKVHQFLKKTGITWLNGWGAVDRDLECVEGRVHSRVVRH